MGDARHEWEEGNRLFDQGAVKEAVAHFERAVRLAPDFAEAFNSLGVAFYEQRDYLRAIPLLQKAVLLKPGFAQALNNLGVCYLFAGRLRDAAVAFEKVLEILPGFAECHNNLGLVYEQLSMTDKAIGHYREFLSLWNGNPRYAYAAKERIDRLTEGRQTSVSEPLDILDSVPSTRERIEVREDAIRTEGENDA